MAYFDYTQPDIPDLSAGIAKIGDALTSVMDKRAQRRKEQEQLQFQREQEQRRYEQQRLQFDYQNRIEDRKERAGELQFNQQQAQHRMQMAEMARKALVDNNPQLAQQIMSGTVSYDPHTGQEIGRGSIEQGPPRDVGPAPLMPMTPEPMPERPMGPLLQPEQERYDAMERENQAASESRRQFDARSAAYSQELKDAEQNRPQILKFGPNDPGITVDMATQRYATRRQAGKDFLEAFRGVPMSEADSNAAQNVYAQIISGTIDPSKAGAAYDKARMGVFQEEGRNTRSAGRDKAIVEAAKARGPAGGATPIAERKLGFEMEKERSGNLRKDLEHFVTRYGAKTIQEDTLQVPRIRKDLEGNPQQQRNAMVQLWQMAQHDHRFSDQDAIMSQTVDPSWLARINNWLSRGTTGELDEDVKQTAIETVDSFANYLANKNGQMRDMARRDFLESGLYPQHEADVLLGQQIPGWARQTHGQGKRGQMGPPEVAAKKKATAKAAEKNAAAGNWVPIPARLANEPQAKGKKEMLVGPDLKFLGEFR